MMPSRKELYLIILHDPTESISAIRDSFKDEARLTAEFLSDLSVLQTAIEDQIPDAFVLYRGQADVQLMEHVKFLRSKLQIDRVPIIAFQAPPTKDDVQRLVSTLSDRGA